MSDSGGSTKHEQMIIAQRERVHNVRSEHFGEGVYGEQSEMAQLQLARVCVEYWSLLREYEGKSAVDELPDIDPIKERLGEQTRMLVESPGLRRGGKFDWRPAILELDIEYILSVIEQLDDVANDLNFSANAADGKGDLYAIKRDPDDYDDPVSDDVPKPE
jgi:hypothetical protein